MDFVVVTTAEGKAIRRDLDLPKISIGRSSKNELVLADLSLSRVHAEIYREGDRFMVKDAGSKNGTLLNDRQITAPTALKKGDRITLGSAQIWFNVEPQQRVEITDKPTPVAGTTVVPVEQLITDPTTLGGASLLERRTALPLEILQKAGEQLVATAPLDDLLLSIMDLVFQAVKPERGCLMLLNARTQSLEPKVVRDEKRGTTTEEITLSRHIADMVVKGKQSVLTSDAMQDPRFEQGASIMAQGIRSAMCVPLWNSREVIGLVYVDSRIRSNSFTPADLRLLSNLANVAAVKIENNRLFEETLAVRAMQRDLELAAQIQRNLMPRSCPPLRGFDIAGTNLPCRTVGGDTYDFLPREGNRLWVAVGDVAGKGLPAAMIMSHFQAMLRGLAEADRPLSQIAAVLNDRLTQTLSANQFISFFLAEVEPDTGILRYVNAGHNPPMKVTASGEVERLKGSGPVLGVVGGVPYPAHETPLAPGEILLLYSDGATESLNTAGEEFGEDRLIDCLKTVRSVESETGLTRLEESILGFCDGAARYDDITLLLIRRAAA
jgi:serine phosphatase RsbU (regulator of sigma subunit)